VGYMLIAVLKGSNALDRSLYKAHELSKTDCTSTAMRAQEGRY